MNEPASDAFTQFLHETIYACLHEHELDLPMVITCIGTNEALVMVRIVMSYSGDGTAVEAIHGPWEGGEQFLALPFHILVTDQVGKAVYAQVARDTSRPKLRLVHSID